MIGQLVAWSTTELASQPTTPVTGNQAINLSIFGAFVCVTLCVAYRFSRRNRTTSDYYAAGNSFTGAQNGLALCGDYVSAAAFLGIAGSIAINGYDGFLYSIGFVVAWLVNLLLVVEPTRNIGRFTVGDVLSFRMRQQPVRAAAATSTMVISLCYLIAQMTGAGSLISLLLNVHSKIGQDALLAILGAIMIGYVLIGGMKGTTWVQILKASFLVTCVALMAVFLIGKFGFNVSSLLTHAVDHNPLGAKILGPGAEYGRSVLAKLDFVSLSLTLLCGVAGMPHILTRFYTVPNAREARRSVVWATWMVFVFYLATLILGYGACALVGAKTIEQSPGGENAAVALLALRIGGTVLLGVIAAVVFATVLAVVSGLTLTASASFAHDVYANIIKHGNVDTAGEIRIARLTAVGIGLLAVVGGILANGQNVAFLVALAFAFAASANLPTILYSLFWKRFNTSGTLWSSYGGLISCLGLVIFSPVVSGSPTSMFPHLDFHWFPLNNPGIVSIPLSFVFGFLGTVLSEEPADPNKRAEMHVRAYTGIGS